MRAARRLVIPTVLLSFLLAGCPYGLVNVQDEEKHQQQVEGEIASLRSDLGQLQGKFSGLDQHVQASSPRLQQAEQSVKELQKQRAELDVRLEEMGLNMRLLQGSIEKRDHRVQEISQSIEAHEFRIQELASAQKGLTERVEGVHGGLASLETRLSGSLANQEQRVKELATKVDELSKNIPPLLAEQASQLKKLSKNLQSYNDRGAGEVEQLGKSLTSLSQALDLLGQKISANVDEQGKSIRSMAKRIESLETQLGVEKGKGKRSGQEPLPEPPGTTSMSLAPLFFQVARVSWRLGHPLAAFDAFRAATQSSIEEEGEERAAMALLRRSEVLAASGDTKGAWAQLEEVASLYPVGGAGEVARQRLARAKALISGADR